MRSNDAAAATPASSQRNKTAERAQPVRGGLPQTRFDCDFSFEALVSHAAYVEVHCWRRSPFRVPEFACSELVSGSRRPRKMR